MVFFFVEGLNSETHRGIAASDYFSCKVSCTAESVSDSCMAPDTAQVKALGTQMAG